MSANPITTELLVKVAQDAAAAGHGGKTAVYERAASQLGISLQTLHRRLNEVTVRPPRKRRADAGQHTLAREESLALAGYVLESARRNGKRLASISTAIDVLRSNGKLLAGRVDEATGEFRALSTSSVRNALRSHGLHPDQLSRPTPKISLASRHPNHVWQIDPSLCVLYYLRGGKARGLQVMEADRFYKNKPANIAKIENERVWRYVITDHTSGTFYVEYVLGAESGANLAHCVINAMQPRGKADPFHGVPFMVMVDPGSANTGAVFKNLCAALSVEVWVNRPGQPWAKGQVEKTNDIVEREFEHGLKFVEVNSLEELNGHAWRWMRKHNAVHIHSRTRRTRYEVWLRITPEQLRLPPAADICRELAVTAPLERTVNAQLLVNYRGREFNVATVPGVNVGDKLLITRNPWRDEDSAQVKLIDADGREVFHVVEAVSRDEFGFRETAAHLGENFKRHAATPAEKNRVEIEQLVMGAASVDEASAKRKAKTLPFNGEIDPYKPVTDAVLPSYLPRRGTALEVRGPTVEVPPLNHVQATKQLKSLLGGLWTPDRFAWLSATYPDGVREEQLQQIVADIKQQAARPELRVVGGK